MTECISAGLQEAVFSQLGLEPAIGTLPDPVVQTGDIVIDVTAAPVLPYAREIFTSVRSMLFELPFVPGTIAIGRVSAVGAEATEVSVGDRVYCDPTLRGRDARGRPAISLQGLTVNGPAARSIQRQYRHGSWAEKLRLPLENVVSIGAIAADDAARWLVLGKMLVPYGGFTNVDLTAGEIVVVKRCDRQLWRCRRRGGTGNGVGPGGRNRAQSRNTRCAGRSPRQSSAPSPHGQR